MQLLELLVSNAGKLVRRDVIRDNLWPDRHIEFDPAINVCIRDLRRILEAHDPRTFIRTIPKHGYVFVADVTVAAPPEPRSLQPAIRRFSGLAAGLAIVVAAALAVIPLRGGGGSATPQTPPAAALNAFIQGEDLYQQHQPHLNTEAARLYRAAIAEDGSYALAWAGLADVLYFGGSELAPDMEASRQAAETALMLDPDLSRATLRLADIAFTHDWDARTAGQLFDRAIVLDPGNVAIRHSHSAFLLATGDRLGAIAELRRALSIDPLSAVMTSDLAWTLSLAGDHDGALAACATLAELTSDSARATACRLRPLLALGRIEEAAEMAATLMTGAGRRIEVVEPDDVLVAFWTWRAESGRDEFVRAVAHARLGQVEQSLALLEMARSERNRRLAFAHILPEFQAMAHHPRFSEIAPFQDGIRLQI